jgi:hypothetical protein
MLWLYRDTNDPDQVARLSTGAFVYILPSLPLFLVLPALLRSGVAFWGAFLLAVAMTLALYAVTFWAAPRLGVRL